MAPTIGERLQQFREIQSNVRRLKSEKESFEQKAAQCQQAAVTRVQEVVTGVQEFETLVQDRTSTLYGYLVLIFQFFNRVSFISVVEVNNNTLKIDN